MNENNELLTYIYQNAKMGVTSCTDLIKMLNGKDNKIKKIVEGELKDSFVGSVSIDELKDYFKKHKVID